MFYVKRQWHRVFVIYSYKMNYLQTQWFKTATILSYLVNTVQASADWSSTLCGVDRGCLRVLRQWADWPGGVGVVLLNAWCPGGEGWKAGLSRGWFAGCLHVTSTQSLQHGGLSVVGLTWQLASPGWPLQEALVGAARLLIPSLGGLRLSLLPHLCWSSKPPGPGQIPGKKIRLYFIMGGVASNLHQSTTNLQIVLLSNEAKELRTWNIVMIKLSFRYEGMKKRSEDIGLQTLCHRKTYIGKFWVKYFNKSRGKKIQKLF